MTDQPPASLPIPQPSSEIMAVLNLIERAARDPSIDIERMVALLQLRNEMEAKAQKQAFAHAMSSAQSEMECIAPDADNPQTRSRYASYAKLDAALRPIYTQHGFTLTFDTADTDKPETVRVICDVFHNGGHCRTYHLDMPADGKGAKGGDVMTRTHATGSAVSYGRRYLLLMIFNAAVGLLPDDDGNAAGKTTPPAPLPSLEECDAALIAASERGMVALQEAWNLLPNERRVQLKTALESVHKPAARKADEADR